MTTPDLAAIEKELDAIDASDAQPILKAALTKNGRALVARVRELEGILRRALDGKCAWMRDARAALGDRPLGGSPSRDGGTA